MSSYLLKKFLVKIRLLEKDVRNVRSAASRPVPVIPNMLHHVRGSCCSHSRLILNSIFCLWSWFRDRIMSEQDWKYSSKCILPQTVYWVDTNVASYPPPPSPFCVKLRIPSKPICHFCFWKSVIPNKRLRAKRNCASTYQIYLEHFKFYEI